MKENTKRFRFILDTNVLFSAIRYKGKPFELLEEAEKKNIEIIIPEYVYDELREVFERNEIDFTLVRITIGSPTRERIKPDPCKI